MNNTTTICVDLHIIITRKGQIHIPFSMCVSRIPTMLIFVKKYQVKIAQGDIFANILNSIYVSKPHFFSSNQLASFSSLYKVYIYMFWQGGFTETIKPNPFSDTSGGFIVGSKADTELIIWFLGRILSRIIAAPYAYLIICYPSYNMGCQFLGL